MVFVRYVLNQNTIWQTDFVTFSLVAATFVGSPYVLLTRGHVNVDVLPLYLGQKGALPPRARLDADVAGLLRGHDGADVPVLARGLGEQLALGIDVAGAAVDSLRGDADRPRHCSRLQYVAEIIKLVTGREPPFGLPDRRERAQAVRPEPTPRR